MDNKEKSTQQVIYDEAKKSIIGLTYLLVDINDIARMESLKNNIDDMFALANDQQFEIDRLRQRIEKLTSVLDVADRSEISVFSGVIKLYLETL